MKTLKDIRADFINYFKSNDHAHVDSSPLVPLNDPTLMFTNAGMVQFKDVFTGQKSFDFKRVVTSQKCVRAGGKHNDLDNVGFTGRHLTFFEMLGNFSFGDYFKDDAINYSWNFLTKNLAIPSNKLYITVYHEDDEAYGIWKKVTGFSDDRIIRIKTSDNFWSMGETGPCGPCTEIFYDHGDKIFGSLPGTKDEDGDRYVEIWNLVFMQFERMADASQVGLPKQCVDTGMGLERISAVVQGGHDNYQTDLFKSLINASEEISRVKSDEKHKFSHRVIADHIRSTSFLIADGVMPSNEGRGYVLRRIIRRAVRHIHALGYNDLMLAQLLPTLVDSMSDAYPQLVNARSLIAEVLNQEESSFRTTLDRGLKLLDLELNKLSSNSKLSGEIAFKLHDTYGFPLDLTQSILMEKGLSIEVGGFNKAMRHQKDMAKKAWSGSGEKVIDKLWFEIYEQVGATEFIGYDNLAGQGKVQCLVQNGELVDYVDNKEDFYVVTNQTPFYAESGGQEGDVGHIELEGTEIDVFDTKKPVPSLHVHKCKLLKGLIKTSDIVGLRVDEANRSNLKANHTATHLLHAVLRRKLGDHVVQKGSLVAGNRLRFDFSHGSPIGRHILNEIETEINELISRNFKVRSKLQQYDEAINSGAMALFGEKYESEVRVIYIDGDVESYYSIELCGGTHVQSLGEIGSFQITSESAIAAGIRRIEAVTNLESFKRSQQYIAIVEDVEKLLKCSKNEMVQRIEQLVQSKKQAEKELAKFKALSARKKIFTEENIKEHGDLKYLVSFVEEVSGKDLRGLAADFILQQKGKLAICLISCDAEQGSVSYIASVSKNATDIVKAKDIVSVVAEYFGSRGGGSDEFAQGGGKLAPKFDKRDLHQHIIKYITSI